MKRFGMALLPLWIGTLLFPVSGCARPISCSSLLLTFADAYGIEGAVYTTESRPWDEGYLSEEMLGRLYGEEVPAYRAAAVLLCSDFDTVRECGVVVCESREDVLRSAVVFDERIRLLCAYDLGAEGEVLTFGRTVVYFALPDGARARDIWRRLL